MAIKQDGRGRGYQRREDEHSYSSGYTDRHIWGVEATWLIFNNPGADLIFYGVEKAGENNRIIKLVLRSFLYL